MPVQLTPTLRAVLDGAPRPPAGLWLSSGSPLVADICAGAGLDLLLIDMEHAPNGLESVLSTLQVLAGHPVTPVVRIPAADTVLVKQVLDLGAQNLLVPMISSVDEAAAVVEAMHYPPRGRRGVGSALARSGRWNRVEGYLEHAAEAVSLTVQIETVAGVEAATGIAAVDGVDAVFVGPADLAASMGHLGRQTHPEVTAAVRRTIADVRAAGRAVGVNAFDPQAAQDYLDAGASFVVVGADVTLLAQGSEALAARWSGSRR